jgi:hypothetical protein
MRVAAVHKSPRAQPVDGPAPTADQLASIVTAAKALWTSALGAGDPRLAILDQVTVLISGLPNGLLGSTTGTTIVIDGSAAGWGWFIDPNPQNNSEFTFRLPSEALAAPPSSPAYGKMDLLTTSRRAGAARGQLGAIERCAWASA